MPYYSIRGICSTSKEWRSLRWDPWTSATSSSPWSRPPTVPTSHLGKSKSWATSSMTLSLSGCFNVTSCHAFFQKRFKHIMSIWQSQSSSLRNNGVSEPRRGSLHLLPSLNTSKTVLFFRQLKKAASFERKSFSRAVLWIASHCWTDSRREEYVKQLSKFIPVTVVGKCAKVGVQIQVHKLGQKSEWSY